MSNSTDYRQSWIPHSNHCTVLEFLFVMLIARKFPIFHLWSYKAPRNLEHITIQVSLIAHLVSLMYFIFIVTFLKSMKYFWRLYLYENIIILIKHQIVWCPKFQIKSVMFEKQQQQKKKKTLTRRRWNRTTEHVSSPTDLKSALHTNEDHPRILCISYVISIEHDTCIYI